MVGVCCRNAGELQDALRHLKKAVEIDADHDGAHYMLGSVYERMGETDPARSEYETAIRLNPDKDRYRRSLRELDEK